MEILYYHGLPENINSNYLIALLIFYKSQEKMLFFHQFENKNENKIEIPIYRENIPEGFSLFTTEKELEIINDYNDENNNDSDNSLINDIYSSIEPIGRYCELCHKKYLIYSVHVKSKEHEEFLLSEKKQFNCIINTFKRVNFFYKEENKSKENSFNFLNSISNNFSTYDSIHGIDKNMFNDNIYIHNDELIKKKRKSKIKSLNISNKEKIKINNINSFDSNSLIN